MDKKKYDDFSKISKQLNKGIQGKLQEQMGIKTYRDFYNAPLDQLLDLLKKNKVRNITQDKISNWKLKARSFYRSWTKGFVVEFYRDTDVEQKRRHGVNVYDINIDDKGGWEPNSGNGQDISFSFFASDPIDLYNTLLNEPGLEQWGENEEAEKNENKKSADKVGDNFLELNLELKKLRIFQENDTVEVKVDSKPSNQLSYLMSGKPTTLQVDFAVPQMANMQSLPQALSYFARFYLKSRKKGSDLGDIVEERLRAGQVNYSVQLDQIYLHPDLAVIGTIVSLQTDPPQISHMQTAMIQIF